MIFSYMRVAFLALSAFLFFSTSAFAYTEGFTESLDHKGIYHGRHESVRVQWVDFVPKCEKCQGLADSYNNTARALMGVRYRITIAEEGLKNYDSWKKRRGNENIEKMDQPPTDRYGNPYTTQEEYEAAALAVSMGAEGIRTETLPKLKAQAKDLESRARALKAAVDKCEKSCQSGEEETSDAVGIPGAELNSLPFEWKGPYPEVCEACRKIAARLNELPALAYQAQANIAAYAAEIDVIRAEIELIQIQDSGFVTYAKYNAQSPQELEKLHQKGKEWSRKYLDELNKKIDALEKEHARETKNLEKITANFHESIKAYNDCLKICKAAAAPIADPPKEQACSFPDKYPAITVGANNEVGSGKHFENEVKNKAKGMALGALGGAMGGGGGFSFGGGASRDDVIGSPGGDSGQQGPPTERDPTSGRKKSVTAGNTDLELRAGFTNDGLVISTEIEDSPGDGTFHAQWIIGPDGKIYVPVRFIIIELYRDWKLTVWWTHDKWVNGEHVYHDEGEEVTFGRDILATWKFFEGAGHAIWSMLGFETAVKGAQTIGTVYDIPPAALEGPCPMRLVNQISLPKQDPVVTQPVVVDFFKKPGDKNITFGDAILDY